MNRPFSWAALQAILDQAGAHHRDRPPVVKITAHDKPTLVNLLNEPIVVPQASDPPLWTLFGVPFFEDADVPADRLRFHHADGRVFDHHADGTVTRVLSGDDPR